MRIQDVMAKEVWTCRPDESLAAAAKIMWDRDVGAVPVVAADGKLVGILTDRDLCMSAYFTGSPLASIPASHAMSKKVFAVRPGQTVESAEELMRSRQVHRLPVLDEAGKLVGMVSLSDLARAARRGAKGVDGAAVTATLAAIVEPRPRPAGSA
jgi:CBS-domain-containing membrane protein